MKYKKTENNTWASLVRTCEDEGIACSYLWRRRDWTCWHYHSYQVPHWFRTIVRIFSNHLAIQCELWLDIARLWLQWDDIVRNSSVLVHRGWMGLSIATIAIQWFARCTIERILPRHWTNSYHRCIDRVSRCLFLLELLCTTCLQGSEWYSPAWVVRLVHRWWHLLERCIC